jgi:exodeoxyribonuclease V alpha subunit
MNGPEAEATLEGVIASVLSELPGGVIFSLRLAKGEVIRVVVTGHGVEPEVGASWQVAGRWRGHAVHGWQLHAPSATCRRIPPRDALVVSWLCTLPGLGPARARRLAERYGRDLGLVLSGGAPVEEIAATLDPNRPHLAARIAANINMSWQTLMGEYKTTAWLDQQGIKDARAARTIVSLMGAQAPEILQANPYVLAGVLPWRRVDNVGRRILANRNLGVDVDLAPERLVGAVDATMRHVVANGDTAAPKAAFIDDVIKRLGREPTPELAEAVVAVAVRNRAVVDGGEVWRSPGCSLMEDEIANRCRRMAHGMEARGPVMVPAPAALDLSLAASTAGGRPLHPEQRDAACKVLGNSLSCLVGGGGTGKTSTCRAIVEAWEGLGGRVEMAALSGKAALRLTEGTGRLGRNCRPALTIHRLLLGLRKRRDGATHWLTPGGKPDAASELPLLDVRTLLVLDEASMIGLGEMHQILEAMPAGCRLLLVGDPFQLPPVSFGVCFHRLVEVERITARLMTIHRQSEASGIPAVAASVRARSVPDLPRFAGAAPGVFMLPCAREEVDAAVEEVIETLDPEGTFAELLVVAALNERGSGSVLSLNTRCHEAHVKRTQAQGVRGWLGQRFAAGEPVVHLRNDYERGLRNGSMGRIIAVDEDGQGLTARFEGIDRDMSFGRDRLVDLALGYAVTAHRAQGSQARRVVIPLSDSTWVDPTWIYTALTRAEEQAVFVGSPGDLAAALGRMPAYERRISNLHIDLEQAPMSSAA